ncbi:MAG: acyl-coenzyme A synthetase/AMP-(fatty) acid ligase, partial [Paracoccaceae bacterium]
MNTNAPGIAPLTSSLFDMGPPPPCPARFNLAAHALDHAAPDDKLALTVIGDGGAMRWTYGEMRAAVLSAAAGLAAAGLRPGDRLMIRIGNDPRFPILFFGANAMGAVPVPTSTMLTAPELALLAANAEPAFLACADEDLPDGLSLPCPVLDDAAMARIMSHAPGRFADTGADDPAFLIYTSGTGGAPKGVLHAQRSAWARRMMWDGWYGLSAADTVLHAGAFNWT